MATITTVKEWPDEACHKLSPPLASTLAIAALILSPYAEAAEWRITPSVNVRETYTDNVGLARQGLEKSDFITDISPGISVTANGPGLKLKTKYAMQYLSYANGSAGNSMFHQLNADAKAELIKNFFFVDGLASVSQQNISPLGPQATNNYSLADNRATVRTVSVSPYLHHAFGSTASSELRYTHNAVSTNAGALSNSRTDGLLLSINSGPAFRTLGWGLQYNHQKINFTDANTQDVTTTTGSLRYMISPQFYLTATGGYDKYDYASLGSATQGAFYTGGFSWRPTERTKISASAGKRFYGKTFSLDSSVRSRSSVWSLSYNEDVTTTQSQFLAPATRNTSDVLNQLFLSSIPDDAARQQAIDRLILSAGLPSALSQPVNYFANQFFLQKRLQASVAITGAKNTVVISLFDLARQAQSVPIGGVAGPANPLDADTRQAGANALWSWKISPQTNVNFNAEYSRTKLVSTDSQQRSKSVSVALSRQFQPKLNGVLRLRRTNQTSDLANGDFRENAIEASLLMRF